MDYKSYPVGSTQEHRFNSKTTFKGVIRRRRCHQCRKTSVIEFDGKFGPTDSCLNNCGPEILSKMLRF
jgi:hypothetical protein